MKKSALIFIALGIATLAVLFLLFKPSANPPLAGEPIQGPQIFVFNVNNGTKLSGPSVMQVSQGARVELQVTASEDDEVHVHGYDVEVALTAGLPKTLSFTATHAGRFAVELHHADIELGTLQVAPR